MLSLLAGLALLWLGSTLVREYLRASPAALARGIRRGGGTVLAGLALVLLLRGQIGLAIVFGGLAYWLVTGRSAPRLAEVLGRGARAAAGARRGRVSRVRSATIEMELHHATGAMTGTVLAGPFEGARLEQLDGPTLLQLLAFCEAADAEGARLLEAYLDRRMAGWRRTAEQGADARAGAEAPLRRGGMSEDEACELLGLSKGASREDVARAHRDVMKRAHPDRGGSTELAARVNEAKDVLMRRHQG